TKQSRCRLFSAGREPEAPTYTVFIYLYPPSILSCSLRSHLPDVRWLLSSQMRRPTVDFTISHSRAVWHGRCPLLEKKIKTNVPGGTMVFFREMKSVNWPDPEPLAEYALTMATR